MTYLTLAAALLLTLAGTAQAQILNVQTNSNSLDGSTWTSAISPIPYSGSTWNTSGQSGANLLTSTGVTTTVGYTLTSDGLGVSNNGSSAGTVITEATTFGYQATLMLTITGLNNNQNYELALVSAYDGSYGGTFAIDSQTTKSTSGNSALTYFSQGQNYVKFVDVTPVDNQIVVSITPGTGSGDFAMLNGFQIAPANIPEPSTYAMMLGGLAVLAFCIRRKAVRGQS